MNKFLTANELADTIESIIWEAKNKLLIVSPYVRLDTHFKKLFDKHKDDPQLSIMLVFGKNESAVSRSLSKTDFDYFKQFPNISIVYVANLHAKYYGNEIKGVVTSINLYDHSFKNNIEFGIYSEHTILENFTNRFINNPDNDAWDKCIEIAKDNDAVFIKRPVYQEKKFMSLSVSKNYIKSEVLLDYTEHFYMRKDSDYKSRRIDEFPDELEFEAGYGERPVRTEEEFKPAMDKIKFKKPEPKAPNPKEWRTVSPQHGYCIRTGEQIPFNPSQPLSRQAWRTWNEFGNMDFAENYCHETGRASYGRTSMRNPIL